MNRRLAKDFENLAEALATFVTLASIQLVLRRLARVRSISVGRGARVPLPAANGSVGLVKGRSPAPTGTQDAPIAAVARSPLKRDSLTRTGPLRDKVKI
jgi:hypothetical protein